MGSSMDDFSSQRWETLAKIKYSDLRMGLSTGGRGLPRATGFAIELFHQTDRALLSHICYHITLFVIFCYLGLPPDRLSLTLTYLLAHKQCVCTLSWSNTQSHTSN